MGERAVSLLPVALLPCNERSLSRFVRNLQAMGAPIFLPAKTIASID